MMGDVLVVGLTDLAGKAAESCKKSCLVWCTRLVVKFSALQLSALVACFAMVTDVEQVRCQPRTGSAKWEMNRLCSGV